METPINTSTSVPPDVNTPLIVRPNNNNTPDRSTLRTVGCVTATAASILATVGIVFGLAYTLSAVFICKNDFDTCLAKNVKENAVGGAIITSIFFSAVLTFTGSLYCYRFRRL